MWCAVVLQGAHTLTVWIDRSGSVDSSALSRVIPELQASLRNSAGRYDGIELVRFSDGSSSSYTERPTKFVWGAPPVAKPFDPSRVKMPLEAIFRQARERFLAEARRQHEAALEKENADYKARVDDQIKRFGDLLFSAPTKSAVCTRFDDLKVRLIDQRRQANLVITDGVMDCADTRLVGRGAQEPDGRLVFLLVPRKGDSVGPSEHERFTVREGRMALLFPTATIIRPYSLDKLADVLDPPNGQPVQVSQGPPARRRESATTPVVMVAGAPSPRAIQNNTPDSARGIDAEKVRDVIASFIRKVQLQEVGISIGPNEGECYTDQMLQTFISAERHKKIGETVSGDKEFLDIIAELRALPSERRSSILRFARTIRRKTWSEGVPAPEGQTLAAVRAEILIANEIVERSEELVRRPGTTAVRQAVSR